MPKLKLQPSACMRRRFFVRFAACQFWGIMAIAPIFLDIRIVLGHNDDSN